MDAETLFHQKVQANVDIFGRIFIVRFGGHFAAVLQGIDVTELPVRPGFSTEKGRCLHAPREAHIKAAVINALFDYNYVDESSVLVSEMPMAGWSRRADLVLANGKLVAFEIKSDADNTQRLEGQLSAYWSMVEGVTVVVGPRHAREVLSCVPSYVGVFIARVSSASVAIELAKKPHIRPLTNEAALQLMRVSDLAALLKAAGKFNRDGADRASLERLASALPISTLRAAALTAVKQKYRVQSQNFLSARRDASTIEALPFLRKAAWARPQKLRQPDAASVLSNAPHELASPLISTLVGLVTPRTVAQKRR